MSWVKIRILGELQMLTRASYIMLVFVPLLAALWPAVRVAINRYNQAITSSQKAMDEAAKRLELIVSNVEPKSDIPNRLLETIQRLDEQTNIIISDYSLKTIEHIGLPNVWVFAFIASLSVTVSHLMYQAFAPDLIQREKLETFVESEMRRYREYKSVAQLEEARDLLEEHRVQVKKHRIPSSGPTRELEEKEILSQLSEIESGAKMKYYIIAEKNSGGSVICGLLYGLSIVLILWITITQTWSVLTAAGWV